MPQGDLGIALNSAISEVEEARGPKKPPPESAALGDAMHAPIASQQAGPYPPHIGFH